MIRHSYRIVLWILLAILAGNPQSRAVGVKPAIPVDFSLSVTPVDQHVCKPESPSYIIEVQGGDDMVELSTAGLPPGASVTFDMNPVLPPMTSMMFIENIGAAPAGSYTIEIIGTVNITPTMHSAWIGLSIFDAAPAQPDPLTPADGENQAALKPVFTWAALEAAESYELTVARDELFSDVVVDVPGLTGTSYELTTNLEGSTTYYWRVSGQNVCGEGIPSAASQFTTGSGTVRIYLPIVKK